MTPPVNAQMASLAAERADAPFPVRALTHFLDGGERMTALFEKFMLELERDPLWRMEDTPNLSLAELRERTMAKAKNVVHYLQNEPIPHFRARMAVISVVDPGFWTRLGVHYGLFIGALQGQATAAQLAHWIQRGALTLTGMVGCFCMTELGHGSNVAGLETTATFDEYADEFVIHTPTLTATKWWIGGAAHSATHGAVFAQLIVRGKNYGVKCFIVPLRNPEDYSLRTGVLIGDCGKKMGRDGIDNGYIQFTNVRIPRSYMLMKHTKVARDGTVTSAAPAQMSYGALIQGRVSMVVDSANTSKKALTIAVRYAAIRRQFGDGPEETKLLDYTIHQHRLLPLLAQTFAMHFAGKQMDHMYTELMDKLDRGDQAALEALKETHATSAGLKAHCTWATLNIIEQCRQSLGGHGYSEYAGLAPLLKDWAVQCSWEGDNTILTLQAGRYLVACYRDATEHKKQLSPGVRYLNALPGILTRKCPVTDADPEALVSERVLAEAFDVVAARAVHTAATEFAAAVAKDSNKDTEAAYEACAPARFRAAKVHSLGYLYARFAEGIRDAPPEVLPVLRTLLALYGAHTVAENAGLFLSAGYFTANHVDAITRHVNHLMQEVRRVAVLLVDAFNYSDYVLNSPLGRYDGDIYTHYHARIAKLNPPFRQHPYFDRVIKPLLTRSLEPDDAPELEDDE